MVLQLANQAFVLSILGIEALAAQALLAPLLLGLVEHLRLAVPGGTKLVLPPDVLLVLDDPAFLDVFQQVVERVRLDDLQDVLHPKLFLSEARRGEQPAKRDDRESAGPVHASAVHR